DVIIGRNERAISCSMRTLYRKFALGEFDVNALPMQGKRKPNGHQEKRGRQSFRRSIRDRDQEHPNYQKEFGHLEGDTIDRKSTRLNSSHVSISYAVFCLKKKTYRPIATDITLTDTVVPCMTQLHNA